MPESIHFTNDGPMTSVLSDQHRLFNQMLNEVSGVYDVFALLEILAFLAPQGVTFDQVFFALTALQPKAPA